jgi:hypothetical protein
MKQGDAVLAEGKRVYESGDRLAAMKVYEKALAMVRTLQHHDDAGTWIGCIPY